MARGVAETVGEITSGVEQRFWKHVNKQQDGCWEWTSVTDIGGYGKFWIEKFRLAHRVSYAIASGEDPGDGLVLHHCDNPPCVNPDHLYLGDRSDNSHDAFERGQLEPLQGEDCPSSKLTADQVREIRRRYEEEDITYPELAEDYPIGAGSISPIIHRKTWRHLDDEEGGEA